MCESKKDVSLKNIFTNDSIDKIQIKSTINECIKSPSIWLFYLYLIGIFVIITVDKCLTAI